MRDLRTWFLGLQTSNSMHIQFLLATLHRYNNNNNNNSWRTWQRGETQSARVRKVNVFLPTRNKKSWEVIKRVYIQRVIVFGLYLTEVPSWSERMRVGRRIPRCKETCRRKLDSKQGGTRHLCLWRFKPCDMLFLEWREHRSAMSLA
jgi:hypothetical protein